MSLQTTTAIFPKIAAATPRATYTHSPYGFDVVGSALSSRTSSVSDIDSYEPSSGGEDATVPHVLTVTRSRRSSTSTTPFGVQPFAASPPLCDSCIDAHLTDAMSAGLDGLPLLKGSVLAVACTAKGSSYLQALLERYPCATLSAIWAEIGAAFPLLLLHKFASYVVRSCLRRMDRSAASSIVFAAVLHDDALLLQMATTDLHARRSFLFLLSEVDGAAPALFDFVMRHAMTVSFTEEGCVAIQRVLDGCSVAQRALFFELVRANLAEFCFDRHASFVAQYMIDKSDVRLTAAVFSHRFARQFVSGLLTHSHAAKVVERLVMRVTCVRLVIMHELLQADQRDVARVLAHDAGCYALVAMAREATHSELEILRACAASLISARFQGKRGGCCLPAARRFADTVARRLGEKGCQ